MSLRTRWLTFRLPIVVTVAMVLALVGTAAAAWRWALRSMATTLAA